MSSEANAAQDHAAGVIAAAPWRMKAVLTLPGYRLAVTFQDDSSATIDCSGVKTAKDSGVYAALSDPSLFEQAGLELGVITWPNGADLDPCWLYDETRGKELWSVPY